MKNILNILLSILFLFSSNVLFAQKKNEVPKLHPLENAHLHAGCYITGTMDSVMASFNEDNIYFNLGKKDELFTPLTDTNQFPKGYTEGYANGAYTIYIKSVEGKKEGCTTQMVYQIIIKNNKKSYKYTLKGFCGC